ncbi:MAG: hypothetical protein QW767_05980 [Thermoprotei archaeon]
MRLGQIAALSATILIVSTLYVAAISGVHLLSGYSDNEELLDSCVTPWPASTSLAVNGSTLEQNASLADAVAYGRNSTPVKVSHVQALYISQIAPEGAFQLCVAYSPLSEPQKIRMLVNVTDLSGGSPDAITVHAKPTAVYVPSVEYAGVQPYYYSIITLDNRGYVGPLILNFPGECGGLPLVAGNVNLSAISREFASWLQLNHTCPAQTPSALLVATSNFTVYAVNYSSAPCVQNQIFSCYSIYSD